MIKMVRSVLARLMMLAVGLSAVEAHAQGWDYGRNMFSYTRLHPGSGWSSVYHPGDGRPGVYYWSAGSGVYLGDPAGRPIAPAWRPPFRHRRHFRHGGSVILPR